MRAALLLVVACACPSKKTDTPATGSGSAAVVVETKPINSCDDARPKLEALYRAEAQQKEPKRVEEAVADNTAMVLKDCKKAPEKAVPCLASATTLEDVEKKCLIQLDDEGTEGDKK